MPGLISGMLPIIVMLVLLLEGEGGEYKMNKNIKSLVAGNRIFNTQFYFLPLDLPENVKENLPDNSFFTQTARK